jgi:hypothetical protein
MCASGSIPPQQIPHMENNMQLIVTGDETYLQDHRMAWIPVSSPPFTNIRPNYYQKRGLYSIFFFPKDVVAKALSPEERTISGILFL